MFNLRFLVALFVAFVASCQLGFAQDRTILGGRVFANGYVPTQRTAATAGYLNELIAQEGKHRWAENHLPLTVFIDSGAGVPGYRANFDSIMVTAFDEWIKTSQGRLSWQRVASPEQANIVITWTAVRMERPEGTEAGLTKTTTRMNPVTREGVIAKVNMHIVTQLPGRMFTDADIKKTCLHEIGHALGLQGHSPNAGDIMYYAISPRQKPALTDRDQATINDLYAL
jgi:predicted Zn-dependent protease